MANLAIVNIGQLITGDITQPVSDGHSILVRDGLIARIWPDRHPDLGEGIDRVIDARGTTVTPGLIDTHCHVVLGDYTPRQKTVDFLDSYVHGGLTSVVSAGEIHAPGRPHAPVAVKALAIAAAQCFANFRPTGMKVHAGTVVLEPGLEPADFAEMAAAGVRAAKVGFGAVQTPLDYVPLVRMAQQAGIKVMVHTGGASIPGSLPITGDHLMAMQPDVAGHVNGGPTALSDAELDMIITGSHMALQLVQAGNLRSALHIVRTAKSHGALDRVLIASDTPTGTGVMPLALLKSCAEIASLGGISGPETIAMASGSGARAFGLTQGVVAEGWPADLVIMDAPEGSRAATAMEALEWGDIPGVTAVIIDGTVVAGQSRNTPRAARFPTGVA